MQVRFSRLQPSGAACHTRPVQHSAVLGFCAAHYSQKGGNHCCVCMYAGSLRTAPDDGSSMSDLTCDPAVFLAHCNCRWLCSHVT